MTAVTTLREARVAIWEDGGQGRNRTARRQAFSGLRAFLALYLIRLSLSDGVDAHEVELQSLPIILRQFVVRGPSLDAAIQIICKGHLGGNQVLFGDLKHELSQISQKCAELLDIYHAIAPQLGFDLIEASDLQSTVADETSKKVDELIRLCRAAAKASFGNPWEARELLLPLIEPHHDNERGP